MVILTAAIMDCFHQGHKNLLEQMRSKGGHVVVILHDDKSCYEIKGKIPIQTVEHRRRNVLLTGLADEVLVTESVDPADKIIQVLDDYSDVLFMRGDDNPDFPGKWVLDFRKVPIELAPYTLGVSSSEIRAEVGSAEV